jgi:hypothetical protein
MAKFRAGDRVVVYHGRGIDTAWEGLEGVVVNPRTKPHGYVTVKPDDTETWKHQMTGDVVYLHPEGLEQTVRVVVLTDGEDETLDRVTG